MTPLESENWVNLIQKFFKNSKVCLDKSGQGPVFFETSPILIMGAFLAAATAATVLKLACAWRSECDIEGVDVQVWEGRSWRSCVQRWNWIRHCFFAISISSQLLKCFRIYFEMSFLDPPMIHRSGDLQNLPRPMRWDHLVRLSSSKVSSHWSSRWHPFLFHQHPDRFPCRRSYPHSFLWVGGRSRLHVVLGLY